VVYTAGSQALAALEMIAHTDDPEQLIAVEYVAMAVDFDEELVTELRRLPRNWKDYPAPAEVRRLGDRWVARETSAVLKIPSVIIPSEYNYVLNPGHPDFVHIVRHKSRKFPFDPRLV
jgi:RES domain-containing protein